MFRHKNELGVGYDVDGTLIEEDPKGSLSLPFGGKIKRFRVLTEHIELLKQHKARGYDITVWSKNGEAWAYQVVSALKLEPYVYETSAKMMMVVDDREDLASIVGPRIFIAKTGGVGWTSILRQMFWGK